MIEHGGGEPGGSARRQTSELRAIQGVADELGVSTRTLRFYEDKGLIEPQRIGTMRVYSRREIGRMRLILRGKRLGFSLKEIKDFLDLYDADPQHVEQMRALSERVHVRIDELKAQHAEIERTIAELRVVEAEAEERVRNAGR
jgi:DNA-binding transcriptional MerR regulator